MVQNVCTHDVQNMRTRTFGCGFMKKVIIYTTVVLIMRASDESPESLFVIVQQLHTLKDKILKSNTQLTKGQVDTLKVELESFKTQFGSVNDYLESSQESKVNDVKSLYKFALQNIVFVSDITV